jgi:prepilin-type N-terminal cleavage/methylation domain-containing protein
MKVKTPAGFTVIELMIVLACMSIFTVIVAGGLIQYRQLYAEIGADQEMANEARTALKWIGRDLRSSSGLLPAAGPYALSENTVVLAGPGGTGAVVWTVKDGALKRIEFSDPAAPGVTQAFVPAGARLAVDLGGNAAAARRVGVKIACSRPMLDHAREFELSGRFRLRGGE